MRTDLVETEHHPLGPLHVVTRIVDYLFGLLYTLLLVRLALELLNAASHAGFFGFVRKVTDPFLAPFRGIVGTTALDETHHLVWSVVIALVVCMLVHALIRGCLSLVAHA